MPVVDNVARFEPLRPGFGKITLSRFNAQQALGPDCVHSIELIVVRQNEAFLADWVSPSVDKFLTIIPRNARQRGQEFEFEVGPEVVNPMAFDNTGVYLLRLRNANGILISFNLSMLGVPKPDTTYVPSQPAPQPAPQGIAGGYEPPKAQPQYNPNAANQYNGMATAPAPASQGGGVGSVLLKVLLVIIILAMLAAGGAYLAYYLGYLKNPLSYLGLDSTATEQIEQIMDAGNEAADNEEEDELTLTDEDKENFTEDMVEGNNKDEQPVDDAAAEEPLPPAEEPVPPAEDPAPAVPVSTGISSAALNAADMFDEEEEAPASNSGALGGSVMRGGAVGPVDPATACTFNNQQGSEQEILSNCLRAAPNAQQIDAFLKEALHSNRCEVVLRILSSKGRAGNGGNYAFLYGLLSDPKIRVTSGCIKKNEQEAQYWYEHAKNDPNFNEAAGQEVARYFFVK